jgi:hypothetical protein
MADSPRFSPPRAPLFMEVVTGLLTEGLSVRFRAAGRSMLPTVRDGECLVVAPIEGGAATAGDVVLCETWRGPLAHRVLRLESKVDGATRVVLQGDASVEPDRPVEASAVRGRVVGVERRGRLRSVALRVHPLERLWRETRPRVRHAVGVVRAWAALALLPAER